MAVAERKRHDPGDLGAGGDVLVARPGDVVGGVADAKDGVEQKLDAAAAGADDEIGARDGVGEALPRAGAHLLDAEQQHDADGDGEHGEHGRQPAVAQRLQGEAQDDHGCRLPSLPAADGDLVEPHHLVEARGQALVVADHDQRRAGLRRFGEQQVEEGGLAVAVERRGRLVGHDQLRRADQRAGGGNALLLADAQVGGRAAARQVRLEAEAASADARPRPRPVPWPSRACGVGREAQRQQHVVDDRAVGQQVEHLEDDAEVLGAEAVAGRGGQPGDVGAEDLDASRLRRDDAAKQAEEGRLAAARRADQQDALGRSAGRSRRPRARRRCAPARRSARPPCAMTSSVPVRGLAVAAAITFVRGLRSCRRDRGAGLARVTSNLLCPLGVMTLTSSFSAPANVRK